MSAGAILLQLSNLVKHTVALGPKLSSNIRPSKGQLEEIQTLRVELKEATASIEAHVERLLQRVAPSDKELKLLNRLRFPESVEELSLQLTTILRKNLILIFRGPDVSALDSKEVKWRRDKTRARCEKLREEAPALILRWSITFPPSKWNSPTVMPDSTFNYLVDELKAEQPSLISSKIVECIDLLKKEEPLKNCKDFQRFIGTTTGTTAGTQDTTVPQAMPNEHHQQAALPSKRKYTTESTATEGSSHEDDHSREKVKLIKRSDEIDYKGSFMPADNLPHLIQRLPAAMGSSKQWKWERRVFQDNVRRSEAVGIDRTDCMTVFVPKNRHDDVSVTLMVGYEAGVALIYETGAQIIRV